MQNGLTGSERTKELSPPKEILTYGPVPDPAALILYPGVSCKIHGLRFDMDGVSSDVHGYLRMCIV